MAESAWMVRAGNDNELADRLEGRGVVAIGWNEMGDLSALRSRSDFKERYSDVYPDHSKYRRGVNAGQIFRFT
jgi:restriction system protein